MLLLKCETEAYHLNGNVISFYQQGLACVQAMQIFFCIALQAHTMKQVSKMRQGLMKA